ncbi:hypothetical protein ACQY1M_24355 (plasmid) [Neorhizobium sp. DAR64861/K0K2]|uniref:hypothetical protein n=1 Tax=Neorhizobium sp. DAR64861/K0K2 TaxID=3421956 RepID=UPI003D2D21B0
MKENATIEARQKIAEKVLARMQDRGFPIHDDQEFLAIIRGWISGEVAMTDCRKRYLELLKTREYERRDRLARPS